MEGYQIGAILEADRVERFLAAAARPASHAEIGTATGIAGTKLTRILASLKTCGRIEEPADGRWALAPEWMALFAHALFADFSRRAEALAHQLETILQRRPA